MTSAAPTRGEPRRFALAGNGLVVIGVAIVLWSVTATSVAGLFVGTVIADAGFGAGFQGGQPPGCSRGDLRPARGSAERLRRARQMSSPPALGRGSRARK
jgi:hypothetical protein